MLLAAEDPEAYHRVQNESIIIIYFMSKFRRISPFFSLPDVLIIDIISEFLPNNVIYTLVQTHKDM